MYSTHKAELNLPCLPHAARLVHIVPALQTASLLSIGQLCDARCDVLFDATSVRVRHDNVLILTGERYALTGLWHLGLDSSAAHNAHSMAPPNSIHHSLAAVATTTPANLVAFTHAALFSPVLFTLKSALDCGFLQDFQGLTTKALTKYPPMSVPMIKGHLHQARKNQRSTTPPRDTTVVPIASATTDDHDPEPDFATFFPISDPHNARTHQCFAAMFEPAAGQIHTDQAGCLLHCHF